MAAEEPVAAAAAEVVAYVYRATITALRDSMVSIQRNTASVGPTWGQLIAMFDEMLADEPEQEEKGFSLAVPKPVFTIKPMGGDNGG